MQSSQNLTFQGIHATIDQERTQRVLYMMLDTMCPAVPKVDLLDPDCEPTDDELAALMCSMRQSVIEKGRASRSKSRAKLAQAFGLDEPQAPTSAPFVS